jgi:hypothetical protein
VCEWVLCRGNHPPDAWRVLSRSKSNHQANSLLQLNKPSDQSALCPDSIPHRRVRVEVECENIRE